MIACRSKNTIAPHRLAGLSMKEECTVLLPTEGSHCTFLIGYHERLVKKGACHTYHEAYTG
jgi:hypothetical protein